MGPNESQLRLVDDAIPGALTAKAIAWNEAKATLDELRSQVDTARRRARATWQGDDAEAALVAFDKKAQTIEQMQERMDSAQQGMRIAADALSGARSALASLEAVPDQPTTPTHPGTDASDDQLTAHSAAMSDHGTAVRARNAAMARREAQAGQALDSLDSQLAVARNLLTKAAPAPTNTDVSTGPNVRTSSTDIGGGAMAAAPVVGGATTAAALTRRPGAAGGSGAGRQSVLRPSASAGLSGSGSSSEGSAPSDAPTLAQAGGSGMGGVGGAAGAAGVIGAGKSIVNKLTGNQARTASPAAGAGRTAGMQKGSTLGASAKPAASAQQAGTTGQRPASALGGRQAGAPASARPASGAPGGARTAGAPSSARPAAGGSRTAGSATGRSATSPGARAGATPAAGRGAAGAGAGAGKPGATAAGARGAGGSAGARGTGASTAARGGSTTGPKGAAAGVRGSARDRRQDDDERRDHLAFDDDQWIDGDETAPGVLS